MWAEGWSASQIAGELRVFTRNAVLGRVHRLGLSRQDKPHSRKGVAKPKRTGEAKLKRKPPFSAITSVGPTQSRISSPTIPSKPQIELPSAQLPKMLTLLELTPRTCRWPIGDPCSSDFGFCGHHCWPDHPYCHHHSLLSNPSRAQGRMASLQLETAGSVDPSPPGRYRAKAHHPPAAQKVA
jgi:GcrA cell cycle regulator